jgi:hypothetical protein
MGPTEDTGLVSVGQASDNAASTKSLFQILPCHGCMSLLSSHLRAIIALGYQWKIGGEGALAVMPTETLLILVFGLVVAGILAGVLVKIVSARRVGVTADHCESNLIDDQYQHGGRKNQRQYGFVDDRRPQGSIDGQREPDCADNFLNRRIQPSAARLRLIRTAVERPIPGEDDLEGAPRAFMATLALAPISSTLKDML